MILFLHIKSFEFLYLISDLCLISVLLFVNCIYLFLKCLNSCLSCCTVLYTWHCTKCVVTKFHQNNKNSCYILSYFMQNSMSMYQNFCNYARICYLTIEAVLMTLGWLLIGTFVIAAGVYYVYDLIHNGFQLNFANYSILMLFLFCCMGLIECCCKKNNESNIIGSDDGGLEHPHLSAGNVNISSISSTIQPIISTSINIHGTESANDLPPKYELPPSYDQCVRCNQVKLSIF